MPKNIFCFQYDEVRPDHLSVHGYERKQTYIDGLAKDGVVFETCVSGASLTPICTGMLWSGCYPAKNGIRDAYGYVVIPTIQQILHERGWKTGGFVSNGLVGAMHGHHVGMDVFSEPGEEQRQKGEVWDNLDALWSRKFGVDSHTPELAGNWYVDEVCDFIRQNKDSNWYAWCQFYETHSGSEKDLIARGLMSLDEYPENFYYDAKIKLADNAVIGKIVDTVRELGLYEDTIFLITSDHGTNLLGPTPPLGDYPVDSILPPGHPTHPGFYEPDIWVPLVMAGPGLPKGKRIPGMVRHVDLVPTLLELVGVDADEHDFDGQSLLPFIEEGKAHGLEAYVEEMAEFRPMGAKQALRTDDWKYIRSLSLMSEEFFDLKRDPREMINLIDQVKTNAPEWLKSARARLNRHLWMVPRIAVGLEQADLSDDDRSVTEKRLRDLGYVR